LQGKKGRKLCRTRNAEGNKFSVYWGFNRWRTSVKYRGKSAGNREKQKNGGGGKTSIPEVLAKPYTTDNPEWKLDPKKETRSPEKKDRKFARKVKKIKDKGKKQGVYMCNYRRKDVADKSCSPIKVSEMTNLNGLRGGGLERV